MASVAELAAALAAALAQAREADTAIAAARDRYTGATTTLAAAADGTDSYELSESLAALADAAERLDTARAAIATAIRDVGLYLGEIGASAYSPSAASAATSAPVGRRLASFQPDVARMVPRRGDSGPTAGVLTDESGKPIPPAPLWSGSPAPTDTTIGVVNRRVARSFSNLHHVECHVAALMRTGQAPPHVVLYLNNAPCRGRRPGERGCDELLPGLLRAGHQLTIHVIDTDGNLRDTKVYRGTGKELV